VTADAVVSHTSAVIAIPEETYESSLKDGTAVLYRPVRPDDKERFRRGLEQLSPRSRYLRFFRVIDHFSDKQLRYLTELDYVDHFAWLAVLPGASGEPGVGVSRWVRLGMDRAVAEGAVTVIDSYQNRGIGKTLLHLAARSAIERGIEAFRVYALGENRAILELLAELGARPGKWDGGVLELTVPLPDRPEDLPQTPAPLILKASAEGRLEEG
jgi:GNAT superfamily N-acetyltransferase